MYYGIRLDDFKLSTLKFLIMYSVTNLTTIADCDVLLTMATVKIVEMSMNGRLG